MSAAFDGVIGLGQTSFLTLVGASALIGTTVSCLTARQRGEPQE